MMRREVRDITIRGARHRSGATWTPDRAATVRERLESPQPLPHGRGSVWSMVYARIPSIGGCLG